MLVLTSVATALGALVVVLTWRRLGRTRAAGGHTDVGVRLVHLHTATGVIAVVAWVAFLVTGGEPTVGIVGLAGWWVTAVAGLLLLLRWLPTRGRHAGEVPAVDRRAPRLWSFVGHLGLVVLSGYFTWAYLAI